MSLGWAAANPLLFIERIKKFQTETPITHWEHRVDLSREHVMKLIAVRRTIPFDSLTEYVTDRAYPKEIGMYL